jgi:hypothetical protein
LLDLCPRNVLLKLLTVSSGGIQWASESTLENVMEMAKDLVGLVGTCSILVITLAFFIFFSLFALCM